MRIFGQREYIKKLMDLEDKSYQNIIALRKTFKTKDYKELYQLRLKHYEILEQAKDMFVEYEPKDIIKILGISSETERNRYCREYMKFQGFLTGLYSDIRTKSMVERCGYYLELIKEKE